MKSRQTRLIASTVLLPFLTSAALADPGGGYGGYHMGMGGWFFGPLMMIFVIALTVVAVVLVLRLIGSGSSIGSSPDRSLDILKERFARGEIDKTEFEERRRALSE